MTAKFNKVFVVGVFLVASVFMFSNASASVLKLHANETSGSTMFDYSGNGYDGTINNRSDIFQGISGGPTNINDDLAYNISGYGFIDYGDQTGFSVLESGKKATISLWVYPRKPGNWSNSEIHTFGIKDEYHVKFVDVNTGSGKVRPQFDMFGDNDGGATTESVPVGEWSMVTKVIHAGSYVVTYVNDTKTANYSTTTTSADSGNNLCLGAFSCSDYNTPTYADEIRVFNQDLNSTEVSNLYQTGETSSTSSSSDSVSAPEFSGSVESDYSWEPPRYNEYWNRIELDPDDKFGGGDTYKWFYMLENQSIAVNGNMSYVYEDKSDTGSGGGVRTRSYGYNLSGSFNTSVYVNAESRSAGLVIWENGTDLTDSKAEGVILDSSASCGSNRFESVRQSTGGDIDSSEVDCSSSTWNSSYWYNLKLEHNNTHTTVYAFENESKSSNLVYKNSFDSQVDKNSIGLWHQTTDSGNEKIYFDAWNFSSNNDFVYDKGWHVNPELMIQQNYTETSPNKWTASTRFWNMMLNPTYNESSGEYYGWSRGKNYSDVSGYPRYYKANGLYDWDTGTLAYNKEGTETTATIQDGSEYRMYWSFQCANQDICMVNSSSRTGFDDNRIVIDRSDYSVENLKNIELFRNQTSGDYRAVVGTRQDAGLYGFDSSDGLNWSILNSGNEVMTQTQDWEAFVSRPRGCMQENGVWRMTYVGDIPGGQGNAGTPYYVNGMAHSTDNGVSWTKEGKVLGGPEYRDKYYKEGSFMDYGARFGTFVETTDGNCHNTDVMFMQAEHDTHDKDGGGFDGWTGVGVMAKNLTGLFVGNEVALNGSGVEFYNEFPQKVRNVKRDRFNLSASNSADANLTGFDMTSPDNNNGTGIFANFTVVAGSGTELDITGNLNYSATEVNVSNDAGWYEVTSVDNQGYWSLTYGDDSGETWSSHTFSAESTNDSTDSTSPSLTIHEPQNQTYSSSEVDLNVTSTEVANYTHNVEKRDGTTVISNTTNNEDDKDLNVTLSGLPDDELTVNVWAEDSAGNTGYSRQDFTVDTSTGYVEINSSVQINQSDNNVFISGNNTFQVDYLDVYSDTTDFGGSNFTVNGSLSDRIDVELEFYNKSKGVGNYPFNFSVDTVDGNNVTFKFSGLTNSNLYRLYKDGSQFKQNTVSTSTLSFYHDTWTSGVYTPFDVLRTDKYFPEIVSKKIRRDFTNSISRLEFGLDEFGESDIDSFKGTGTKNTFSNSSLKLDVTLPVDSNYNISDTTGLTSPNKKIDLSETDTGLVEDTGYSHNLNSQKRKQTVSLTNNGSESIDYVLNLSTGDDFSGSIGVDSKVEKTGTETSDFINNNTFGFSVDTDEVTLGFNYTGHFPLEVDNTASNSWSGVDTTGAYSSPNKCSTTNNTAVDISAGVKKNFSVEQQCNPGVKGNPTQSIENISDDSERVWYNSTDMQIYTNETSETNVAIRADKDNLKNPDQRDGGSLKTVVEGVSSEGNNNLNVSDTGGYFRITVGDIQSSTLYTDDSDWSVTYTLSGDNTTIIDDGGGGGGGTGPSTDDQTVYFGQAQTQEGLETLNVRFGTETVRNFTITNTAQEDLTATLSVGSDDVCQYIEVRPTLNSDQWSSSGSYSVDKAELNNLGTVQETTVDTQLKFNLPNKTELEEVGITDYSCSFETGSSYGVAEPLTMELEQGFSLVRFLEGLDLIREYCFQTASLTGNFTGEQVESGGEVCIPMLTPISGSVLGFVAVFGFVGVRREWF